VFSVCSLLPGIASYCPPPDSSYNLVNYIHYCSHNFRLEVSQGGDLPFNLLFSLCEISHFVQTAYCKYCLMYHFLVQPSASSSTILLQKQSWYLLSCYFCYHCGAGILKAATIVVGSNDFYFITSMQCIVEHYTLSVILWPVLLLLELRP